MSSPELLHIIKITVGPTLSAPLEAVLVQLDIAVSRWEQADGNEHRFDVFFDDAREAKQLASVLNELLTSIAGDQAWDIHMDAIPNEDWQVSWKAYFHVDRVSERIVTKPTWEPYTPTPGDCVIEIDPGMSFGTGQHATTKGCLCFLDTLTNGPTPGSFLDLGCGSGILSIAAAKLGYEPITAIDLDPDAVRIAGENMTLNHVSDRVEVYGADVSTLDVEHPYSIVAANILAPVLLANASHIAATVISPKGNLLLAGILTEQYNDVCETYTALGFEEVNRITDEEWTSGCFRRRDT